MGIVQFSVVADQNGIGKNWETPNGISLLTFSAAANLKGGELAFSIIDIESTLGTTTTPGIFSSTYTEKVGVYAGLGTLEVNPWTAEAEGNLAGIGISLAFSAGPMKASFGAGAGVDPRRCGVSCNGSIGACAGGAADIAIIALGRALQGPGGTAARDHAAKQERQRQQQLEAGRNAIAARSTATLNSRVYSSSKRVPSEDPKLVPDENGNLISSFLQ